MAYGITQTGTRVKYWIDQGDSLPLFWMIKKHDGTFHQLSFPNTFTVTPRSGGNPTVITLDIGGDWASGVLDSSTLDPGEYDVKYYDSALDLSLRGDLEVL